MASQTSGNCGTDIVISFYRNPHLVAPLFQSLQQVPVRTELKLQKCSLVLINDSPEDAKLQEALEDAVLGIDPDVPSEVWKNAENLGFVRSVNRALRGAIERNRNVILLNSDTIVYPGVFTEMHQIAGQDPLIGFVSPRSNNATICSLPHQEHFRHNSPPDSRAIFQCLSCYLPRYQFIPVGVGFCLFIKAEVLAEFGVFDESYGAGYDEENDLIMRANRCGYRAALANRAFVYHAGEASFAISDAPKETQEPVNARLLNTRYPEFLAGVHRYQNGARYRAETLLAGLVPDRQGRLDLLFDLSSVAPRHNGTFAIGKELLTRAATAWPEFRIHAMISEEALLFHHLNEIQGISFVPLGAQRKFAVAFRPAQPFAFDQMARLSSLAAVNIYGMLDPIALDCLYLNTKYSDDLESLWQAVFSHADGVFFISDFVAELFRHRFSFRPGLHELVAYPSLDFRDYGKASAADGGCHHILVVGNHFEHKRIVVTVEALKEEFPGEKIVVVGMQTKNCENVISYRSGHLPAHEMNRLFSDAHFVVFPSLYEGFGLPAIEGLAFRKPVLARASPLFQTLKQRIDASDNLILYSSTKGLVERLKQGFPSWRGNGSDDFGEPSAGWDAAVRQIGALLNDAVQSVDFEKVLVPRMEHMLLWQRAPVDTRGSELENQIQEIYKSWSWRLTAPVRWAGSAYLRMRGK